MTWGMRGTRRESGLRRACQSGQIQVLQVTNVILSIAVPYSHGHWHLYTALCVVYSSEAPRYTDLRDHVQII